MPFFLYSMTSNYIVPSKLVFGGIIDNYMLGKMLDI